MPDRIPPITSNDLPPTERGAADSLTSIVGSMFGAPQSSPFVYARPDGTLVGPFPFFLAAPEAGEAVMALHAQLARIPGLPADAKEVAILTVGAHYQSAYELYAHVNVATKKVGMEKGVVEALAEGKGKPAGLSEAGDLAYDVARYLVATPGPLEKGLWEKCIKVFGRSGTVALVHYVGAYAYLCMALNAMDCPVPEES